MGMDIKKLLAELDDAASRSSSSSGKTTRVPNDATEQQQADELHTSLANYINPPAFKPGDLVRYRKEMAGMVRNYDRLHIVYERLEKPTQLEIDSDNDGDPTTYRKYDLIIGVTNPKEKGAILKYPADSRELEYWPDGERLKRQGNA